MIEKQVNKTQCSSNVVNVLSGLPKLFYAFTYFYNNIKMYVFFLK